MNHTGVRVPLGSVANPVKRKAKTGSLLPVYSVTKHSGFVPSLEYFKKQVFSRDTKGYREVQRGEVAYATIHLDEGSIGVSPEDCIISPMYTVFEVDSAKVDALFLVRFMKSPEALFQYDILGKGSIHRRRAISFRRLSELRIPLPPLGEQKRIVGILDAADAFRTRRRESLAQLDTLLQSTFLDMFGDPVANTMGWNTVLLGDLALRKGGSVDPRKHLDEAFELYSIRAFDTGAPEVTTGSEIGSSKKAVQPNDVMISRIVPHIRRAWVVGRSSSHRQIASGEWIIFRTDATSPQYLRFLLRSDAFHSVFMRTVSGVGGSLLRARPALVFRIEIALPPIELQHRFAAVVESVEQQKSRQRAHLSELSTLCASLQQRAFNGELSA